MPSRTVTSLPHKEYPVAEGDFDKTRAPINLVILHTEVGFRTGTEATFNNPQTHVSAHYGVNIDGSLDHYLEEDYTAYANGDYTTNQRAISIEHEDLGKPFDPRPDVLYEASARLVADICTFHQIPIDRAHIIKHNEVVKANGFKVQTGCPDSLDVERIVARAKELATPVVLQPTPTPSVDQPQGHVFDEGTANFLVEKFTTLKSKSGQPWGNPEGMLREVFGDWIEWTRPDANGKPKVIMSADAFQALSQKAANVPPAPSKDQTNLLKDAVDKLGSLYNTLFISK